MLYLEMKMIKFIYLCWSGHVFTLCLRIIYLSSIGVGRALLTDRKVKPREEQRRAQDSSAEQP